MNWSYFVIELIMTIVLIYTILYSYMWFSYYTYVYVYMIELSKIFILKSMCALILKDLANESLPCLKFSITGFLKKIDGHSPSKVDIFCFSRAMWQHHVEMSIKPQLENQRLAKFWTW